MSAVLVIFFYIVTLSKEPGGEEQEEQEQEWRMDSGTPLQELLVGGKAEVGAGSIILQNLKTV